MQIIELFLGIIWGLAFTFLGVIRRKQLEKAKSELIPPFDYWNRANAIMLIVYTISGIFLMYITDVILLLWYDRTSAITSNFAGWCLVFSCIGAFVGGCFGLISDMIESGLFQQNLKGFGFALLVVLLFVGLFSQENFITLIGSALFSRLCFGSVVALRLRRKQNGTKNPPHS